MAWQIPQSQTLAGLVVNLGTTDDVFVASGVTIASTGSTAILGSGSGHEALIYGTVAAGANSAAISLGDNFILDSGEIVTIKPGGQVHALSASAMVISAFNSHVTNQGLIAGVDGIRIGGINAVTMSTVNNSGTIDADAMAVVRNVGSPTETIVLHNSGLISGDNFAYSGGSAVASDLITNTGVMMGTVNLAAGNDVYNGAQGRLVGSVLGGDGNDVIIGGGDNDVLNGGAGNDTVRGGRGRDSLFGESERDLFDFNSIKDSLKGAKRDVINDFVHGNNVTGDDIDLRTIDAKTGVGGNQAFKFIGKNDFHDKKGELRIEDKGAQVIVQGDRNGDGKADFEILVKVGTLTAGDFLL